PSPRFPPRAPLRGPRAPPPGKSPTPRGSAKIPGHKRYPGASKTRAPATPWTRPQHRGGVLASPHPSAGGVAGLGWGVLLARPTHRPLGVLRTMRKLFVPGSLLVLLLAGAVLAAEPVKSGPQVGQDVGAFEPLNLTGPYAGEEKCLVCAN